MNNPLLQMAMAQVLREPSTENIGTPEEPVWKISLEGTGNDQVEFAKWLMDMADTTSAGEFNQDDPEVNYMSDLEDIFPDQDPASVAPTFMRNFGQNLIGDDDE